MDKNLFLDLLNHYHSGSTLEDARVLGMLRKQFPYSQVLHTLLARFSKDHGLEGQENALHMAAIHAADRALLKAIMLKKADPEITAGAGTGETAVAAAPAPETETTTGQAVSSTVDAVDVAEEVMHDLQRLNELKHNFEMLFSEESSPAPVETPVVETPATSTRETEVQATETAPASTEEKPKTRSKKSKRERIIALAKELNAKGAAGDQSMVQKDKPKKQRQEPADKLIEEITATKKAIEPQNEKLKEQIELIDQFIRTQPTISSPRDRVINIAVDLNPIKTGEFGDNIVSETLVEILLKQGKKEKAVEVLKKLIWKYPQKKAYFASRIEDLKK